MDFSDVRIDLRDKNGVLLAKSFCSPGGFYFMPIMSDVSAIKKPFKANYSMNGREH